MACSNSGVLRTSYNQLTGGQRVALLAEATQYGVDITRAQTQFKSNAQYLAYRKAQTIARSTNGPGPVPSVLVTDLQATYQDPRNVIYTDTFNFLTSPSTTVINSTGQGYLFNVYWKVSDTSSSVWAYMPNLTTVHQITSVTLSYYSGFNQNETYISDATFRMTRDKNPFVPFPDTVSLLLLYAYRKRVVPAQAGDVYALGSPDQATASPITYPNTSTTITDPAFLRAFFGNGTDIIDRSTGFQFYWFTGYGGTLINNSQINEFVINYTYTQCPAIPYNIPTAPFSPLVVGGDGSAVVSWSPPENGGGGPVAYYIVTATPEMGLRPRVQYATEYQLLNGVYYPVPRTGVVRSTGASSPMTLTGLTNGTTYTFTVVAVAAGGTSAVSDSSDPVTPLALPSPPQSIEAVAGNGVATVSWTEAVSDGGASLEGYRVTTTPGGSTITVSGLSTSITGLTNGTAYTFEIQTVTARGPSTPLTSQPVTPLGPLSAPRSVLAVAGDGTATISWSAPASTGGARLNEYRVVSSPAGFTVTVTDLSDNIIVNSTGLTNGTSYTFTVTAMTLEGTSSSASSGPVTPLALPSPPRSVVAVAGDASVTLTWSAPVSTGGVPLQNYSVTILPGSSVRTVTTLLATVTFTATGLVNGTAYTFEVRANTARGPSIPAISSSATPWTAPDPPTALTAIPGNGQALLSWTPPLNNGGRPLSNYRLLVNNQVITTDLSSSVITGLTNGTTYFFEVSSYNGRYSEIARSGSFEPANVPTAVTAVTATLMGDGAVRVSWTGGFNGGSDLLDYTVTSDPSGSAVVIGGPASSTLLTDVSANVTYRFFVVARNAVGPSVTSAPSNTIRLTAPSAPLIGTATAGNKLATVTWSSPVDTGGYGVSTYTVTSSPGGITVDVAGSVNQTTVTGLTNGVSYTFTVKATNTGGISLPSASSAAVMPLALPGPPTAVTASFDSATYPGTVLVDWTPPLDNGGAQISSYTITSAPSGLHLVINALSTSPVTVSLTDFTLPGLYTFTIVAATANGPSVPSAPSAPILLGAPTPPTGVVAVSNGITALVSWTLPVTDGGYPILYYTVRATDPSENTVIQSVFGPTFTSMTMTGLTNGVAYTFDALAGNSRFPSEWSQAPLSAPWNVVAVAGVRQATVSWRPPLSTGGLSVLYYLINTQPGGVAVVAGTLTQTTIVGLTTGVSYFFTVVSVTAVAEVESLPSNTVVPALGPDAPTNVVAVRGASQQASVSWTAPLYNGGSPITRYRVTSNPAAFDTSGSFTSVTATGLTNGQAYTFTVVAFNIFGSSSPSAASAPVTPATVPSAPTAVVASNINVEGVYTYASVSWAAPATNGSAITNYYIYPYDTQGLFHLPYTDLNGSAITPDGNGRVTTTIGGLTLGRIYSFYIVAKNGIAGTSNASALSTAITIPNVPSVPTIVSASLSSLYPIAGYPYKNGSARVTWNAPNNNGDAITLYEIRPHNPPGGGYPGTTPVTDVTPLNGQVTALVNGLLLGQSYDFTVVATNGVGPSVASGYSSTVTMQTAPDAPINVVATAGFGGAFSAPPCKVSVSLPVENAIPPNPNTNGSAIIEATVNAYYANSNVLVDYRVSQINGATSFTTTFTNLPNGNYYFIAYARNSVGQSLPSNPSNIYTV